MERNGSISFCDPAGSLLGGGAAGSAAIYMQAAQLFCAAANPRRFAGSRVLVADDDPLMHRLLDRILRQNHLAPFHALDGEEALRMVHAAAPDVVVTDISMPKMNGMELCRRLKSDCRTALLPVMLLTSSHRLEDKVSGFEAGADEYLEKPFDSSELSARLRSMLRTKKLTDQLEDAEQVIFSLARAVEAKDHYTAGHIERVSALAVEIGQRLDFDPTACFHLYKGGVLHDIGKIGVRDSVLNKPGSLTPDEFAEVKRHPMVGEEICHSLRTLRPVLDMIRHHHERLDGTGYPDHLAGGDISPESRILAVCDVYDALTSNRPYRKALSKDVALSELRREASLGHLDGDMVAAAEGALKSETRNAG